MGGDPPRSRARRVVAAWAAAVLWAALVLGLSGERFGADETASWIGALLEALLPGLDGAARGALHGATRKAAHVAEYAVLAALLFRALRLSVPGGPGPWRAAALALALGAALSALDEGRQSHLPGRSGRPSDVALDLGGAVAGLFAAALWMRRRAAGAARDAGSGP